MGLNSVIVNEHAGIQSCVLHWPESLNPGVDQFFDFCQANKELRIERNAEGDCEIMTPTGGSTGWRNSKLVTQLTIWADRDDSGVVFDSSTGFILPNGAMRSPDVSWVNKSRLTHLTAKQKQQFLPLSPDFVIELKSPSDSLKNLQAKMQEFIMNGTGLGWLIDPENRRVLIYRTDTAENVLDKPQSITAEAVVTGFTLDLQKIWEMGF